MVDHEFAHYTTNDVVVRIGRGAAANTRRDPWISTVVGSGRQVDDRTLGKIMTPRMGTATNVILFRLNLNEYARAGGDGGHQPDRKRRRPHPQSCTRSRTSVPPPIGYGFTYDLECALR
jgi:hypothetical protein